ncbi:vesicle transport protein GOT1B [Mustela lutreola]|uniref:vesicle transport protein GOT1B n=1 Tax=Mustela lutreola TaxID=9666 RepID=UPI0027970A02|nr:vesicle transport protein GOT1B [Mustela lutreola]
MTTSGTHWCSVCYFRTRDSTTVNTSRGHSRSLGLEQTPRRNHRLEQTPAPLSPAPAFRKQQLPYARASPGGAARIQTPGLKDPFTPPSPAASLSDLKVPALHTILTDFSRTRVKTSRHQPFLFLQLRAPALPTTDDWFTLGAGSANGKRSWSWGGEGCVFPEDVEALPWAVSRLLFSRLCFTPWAPGGPVAAALTAAAMISLTDTQKIGMGLTGFGVFFLFFGMILFFDKALLAIGNVLFVAGLAFVIGLERTFRFFFQKHKMKATGFFLGGVFVVLIGWPLIGMIFEIYGFFLLFRGFFPVVIGFIRRVPVLGSLLNLPGIRSFVDKVGESNNMV